MAKRKQNQPTGKPARKPAPKRLAASLTQCHFVSNTHWDREWKASAQRNRYRLVQMMDTLLEILEREPKYKSFHLDSQVAPLLDYLEIRPEREAAIRKLAKAGRLILGPWLTLPDEFCISGESLIRNLLFGHEVAAKFGPVAKTGYSPFSWGQISQMPQIYRGFGIEMIMFYRGVNTLVAPRAEFVWRGPDGSQIVGSRLGYRPRYNAWYVLQRPAYWGLPLDKLNHFERRWAQGAGPFRMIDAANEDCEYTLAHAPYAYDAKVMPAAAEQALREQNGDWSTRHRLWSAGHDQSYPDVREVRLIADSAKALRGKANVFHSTIADFQAGVLKSWNPAWPVVKGEMRHTFTKGSTSPLLGWILSARTYLKQDNHATEHLLTTLAEPLSVFASLLGAPYPRAFVREAYRHLLLNHAHDSIGGCGRDVVANDMLYRSRQSREIATCMMETALREIAGAVDLRDWRPDDMAIVVYNPLPNRRSETLSLAIDIPREWSAAAFTLETDDGASIPLQTDRVERGYSEAVENPSDVVGYLLADRHHIRAAVPDLPGCGYRTLRVRRGGAPIAVNDSLRTGRGYTMRNEHLEVTINDNGTVRVVDLANGAVYDRLAYLADSAAGGNPWQHQPPANDIQFTTMDLPRPAEIRVLREGPLECTFEVAFDWLLPSGLSEDGKSRRRSQTAMPVRNRITLRRGQPWLEFETTIENTIRDHYLRVCFPTGLRGATHADAQTPLDVVRRPIAPPDPAQFDEPWQAEQPMQGFVDISDQGRGLAVFGEGLRAYTSKDDPQRTIELTLIRAYEMKFFIPERADRPHLSADSQMPGRHTFRYAVMPHIGDWQTGGVWQAAARFLTPPLAAQIGPTAHGTQPRTRSFLELEPNMLHVSAIKQSEDGKGWIVRLLNPSDAPLQGRIRLNTGRAPAKTQDSLMKRVENEYALPAAPGPKWKTVRLVSLAEAPGKSLTLDREGWAKIEAGAKQILTIEFRS